MTRLPLCHICRARHPYREHGVKITFPPLDLSNPTTRALIQEYFDDATAVWEPIPERRWWRK